MRQSPWTNKGFGTVYDLTVMDTTVGSRPPQTFTRASLPKEHFGTFKHKFSYTPSLSTPNPPSEYRHGDGGEVSRVGCRS